MSKLCRLVVLCLYGSISLLAGCGSSTTATSTVTPKFKVNGVTNASSLFSVSENVDLMEEFRQIEDGLMAFAAGDWAKSSGIGTSNGQLESLEYLIRDIQLCESVTESGSGYSNPTGCATIYTNSVTIDYDTFLIAQAEAQTTGWLNILDNSALSSAFSNASITPRTYRYGLVNFARPFKVKGSVNVGGTILNTCGTSAAGYAISDNGGTGLNLKQTVSVTNLTTCTKEKVALMLSNGGTLFRIGGGGYTVSANGSYVVDMAFNPEGFLAGQTDSTAGVSTTELKDATRAISLPFMDISPVIRETTQKTYKMVYTSDNNSFSGTGTSFSLKLRLELYFAGSAASDASTATIQGINFATLKPTAGANAYFGASGSTMVNTRTSTTATSGEIDILNYNGDPVITGLNRSISTSATDTVVMDLEKLGIVGGSTSQSVTFTLSAIEEVQ